MTARIDLPPVERPETTTLIDNYTDISLPSTAVIKRHPLADGEGRPCKQPLAGHGFSLLLELYLHRLGKMADLSRVRGVGRETHGCRQGGTLPKIEANGIQICYELHGPEGAEVAVLSNGVLAGTASWVAHTPTLAERCRVLLYDCRGMWQSDHPPEPYSIDLYADNLEKGGER
jgi:hypothetical protein